MTLTPTTPHCSLLTWQRCIFVKEFALRWIKRLVSNLTFNPNLPSLKAAFCLFKASQSRALCLLLAARGKSLSCQQRLNTRWLHRHREPLSLSNKGISLARKRLIVADVKTDIFQWSSSQTRAQRWKPNQPGLDLPVGTGKLSCGGCW